MSGRPVKMEAVRLSETSEPRLPHGVHTNKKTTKRNAIVLATALYLSVNLKV